MVFFRRRAVMPESVTKSLGLTHPATGQSMEGQREGGRYGSRYYKKEYGASAPSGLYAALLIPLIIGAIWMAYVIVGSKVKPGIEKLSPATNSLVVVLFIFIIVYSIFLVLFFLGRRKALKVRKVGTIKKYKKKKRK